MTDKDLLRRTHQTFLNSAKKERTEKINQHQSNIDYYYNNTTIPNEYHKKLAYNGKVYLRWLNIYCKSLEY